MKRFIKNNKGTLLFIFLMLFFRTAVADWYHVPSGSMQPNILIGDRVWVNKLAYDFKVPFTEINLKRHAEPLNGDVVVFKSAKENKRLVKRVIGLPGDSVEMINNQLIINQQPLNYSIATNSTTKTYREEYPNSDFSIQLQIDSGMKESVYASAAVSSFQAVVVPADHYLVLGDNRDNSKDSRFIGFVPRHELVGRADKVLISLDKTNYYLPRKKRFMTAL
jgi:signal peptidase I